MQSDLTSGDSDLSLDKKKRKAKMNSLFQKSDDEREKD